RTPPIGSSESIISSRPVGLAHSEPQWSWPSAGTSKSNPQRASRKQRALRPNTTEPLSRPLIFLLGNEREQFRVDLILMGRGEAVRSARVVDFLGALDEPGRLLRSVLDRTDLLVPPF